MKYKMEEEKIEANFQSIVQSINITFTIKYLEQNGDRI